MEITAKIFLHLIQFAGFLFSQITNATLLFLVLTRAEKLFGSYRNVMAAFASYSLGYTWIEVLAQPVMHIKGAMFIVMMDGPIKMEAWMGNLLGSLYCGSTALCISLLTAQFYYRYVALCKPEILQKLKGWKLLLLFVPCFLCFIFWFSLVHYGMHNTHEKQHFMWEVMAENYGVDLFNESFIGPMYYTYDENGARILRWVDIMASVGCSCMMGTGLSLIAFCIFNIYSKLKNAGITMSPKTKELNRQLFVTLSLQTMLPLVMLYIPIGTFITLPFLKSDWDELETIAELQLGCIQLLSHSLLYFSLKISEGLCYAKENEQFMCIIRRRGVRIYFQALHFNKKDF